jgi:hypothetical protein
MTRVESGDFCRYFQSLSALPALKHDITHGSPTALAVGDSHNLSSFSSLIMTILAVQVRHSDPAVKHQLRCCLTLGYHAYRLDNVHSVGTIHQYMSDGNDDHNGAEYAIQWL